MIVAAITSFIVRPPLEARSCKESKPGIEAAIFRRIAENLCLSSTLLYKGTRTGRLMELVRNCNLTGAVHSGRDT